ncbi:MAG: ribbon-helix-helix domain-containing protein [Zestosphaera sp.]
MKIPEELMKLVDEVIKTGKYGYRSRMEFVIDAVRRRLEQLGYLK